MLSKESAQKDLDGIRKQMSDLRHQAASFTTMLQGIQVKLHGYTAIESYLATKIETCVSDDKTEDEAPGD